MRTIVFVAACLAATPASAQNLGLGFLQRMDSNGDGAVTRAEAQAGRAAMFNRLDADGDGYLSATERSAAQGRAGRGLAHADADGDGRVSRAEVTNMPYRGFDRIDANDDDILSVEEIEAVRARRNGG